MGILSTLSSWWYHIFLAHPKEHGYTYFSHLARAWSMGFSLFKTSLTLGIHGLFPFVFKTNGSDTIKRLYGELPATKHTYECPPPPPGSNDISYFDVFTTPEQHMITPRNIPPIRLTPILDPSSANNTPKALCLI